VRRLIASSLIVILTIPLAHNISTDSRWEKLFETIPMAVNTSNSLHWLNRSLPGPKTESGYEVIGSNYERVAWAAKAVEYVIDEPQGIGFGRNAFGHAMEMRHPELANRGSHTHSSILTLAVGAGIVAVLLWLIFVFIIVKSAIKEFKSTYNYFSILTLFVTMGFVGRSFVDGNMSDHMFLQFMLILGISLLFLFKEKESALIQ
jgi:hypothetical protein